MRAWVAARSASSLPSRMIRLEVGEELFVFAFVIRSGIRPGAEISMGRG